MYSNFPKRRIWISFGKFMQHFLPDCWRYLTFWYSHSLLTQAIRKAKSCDEKSLRLKARRPSNIRFIKIFKYFWNLELLLKFHGKYTVLHMFRQVLFGAGNQSNHQNFKKSLLSCKCGLIFIGMKQKKIFFLKNKIQNGRLKKTFMKKYWELAELENEVFLSRPFWFF